MEYFTLKQLFHEDFSLNFDPPGLQKRCGGVFAQLAEASCSDLGTEANDKGNKSRKVWPGRTTSGMRLHAVHALSMDAILSMGVEMGSHSAECWKHVFRYDIQKRC